MDKKFHCLIVDTTAFIENVALQVNISIFRTIRPTIQISRSKQDYADFVITVPEVVSEIKNKRQLKRLCILPYDLTVDEPSPESVRHVIDFAKKTGDYLSLSSADIKVIALTYQLEKELVGVTHLRTEPVVAKLIASREKPAELIDTKPLAGFYMPPNKEQLDLKEKLNDGLIELNESAKDKEQDVEDNAEDIDLELKEQIENLHIDVEKTAEVDNVLVQIENGKETEEENESDDTETEGLCKSKLGVVLATKIMIFILQF